MRMRPLPMLRPMGGLALCRPTLSGELQKLTLVLLLLLLRAVMLMLGSWEIRWQVLGSAGTP